MGCDKNSYGNLTSFFATEKEKKERQVYLLGCLSIYVLDQLMLDDYTIEELSSDEYDKISRKTNKFRLVLDVTDIIIRRKEKIITYTQFIVNYYLALNTTTYLQCNEIESFLVT